MYTNIDIDDKLMKEALALGSAKTKNAVVNEALVEYVLARKQRRLLELFGTVDVDPDYDYKKERSR